MIYRLSRAGDVSVMRFALLTATLMIAQQVAGKATRDALFLSHFEVTQLPKVVIAGAVLSMLTVLGFTRLLSRYGPSNVIPLTFGLSATLYAAQWVLYGIAPNAVAVLLYLQMAAFGAALISGFWSLISERFDPHSAKRNIARISAAATLGGVLGGVVAERVATLVQVEAMLVVLCLLHLVCAGAIVRVAGTRRETISKVDISLGTSLRLLATKSYLREMALLMVLMASMAALLDYALKATASATFSTSQSLVAFFATFYAGVGVLSFLLQSTLGPRVLQRFGVGPTLALLPALVIFTGVIGTALTKLWTMVVVRGSHAMLAHSFFRSAFELLYIPLSPQQKRPTKAIIDVASDRVGDVLGGGFILFMLALSPALPISYVVGTAVAAAMGVLFFVTRLHRRYVDQLAGNLRKGAVSLEGDKTLDVTTRQMLAETSAYSEREILMGRLKARRKSSVLAEAAGRASLTGDASRVSSDKLDVKDWGEPQTSDGPTYQEVGEETVAPVPDAERLIKATIRLTSGNVKLVRRALISDYMDVRLVPYLIPLLGNDAVAEDIRMELRWMAPRIIGQLTDALLDPDMPLLVRQRLPGVLEVSHNPRIIHSLLQGLADEEFNVRYSCTRALARMRARDADLRISDETVFAAVQREVNVDLEVWRGRDLMVDMDLSTENVMDTSSIHRADRSLEHVFNLLSLILDQEAVKSGFRALVSTDQNLRGTALEYLENVLPERLKAALWNQLGVDAAPKKPRSRVPSGAPKAEAAQKK